MGQIKHKMGKVGGGVDISHKSKMSGKAKSLMSFPGGMPGKQDSNRVVGKGMMEYLDGQPVGMGKYKHSSVPMYGGEKGMPKIGDKKNLTEKYEKEAGDGIKTVKLKEGEDLKPRSKFDRMSPEEKKAFLAKMKRKKEYNTYKKDKGVNISQDESTFERYEKKNKKKKTK